MKNFNNTNGEFIVYKILLSAVWVPNTYEIITNRGSIHKYLHCEANINKYLKYKIHKKYGER